MNSQTHWGATSLDNSALIPEMLHDSDKPQMRAFLQADESLACEVAP